MSNANRTSLRISLKRQAKLAEIRKKWRLPSNDETIGFLLDIADAEKMGEAAARHLSRINNLKVKEAQDRAQLDKIMSKLTSDQIAKIIAGNI